MTKVEVKRRTFLRLSLLGGIGAGLAYLQHKTANIGLMNFIRWSVRGELQRVLPPAIVGLEKSASYDDELISKLEKLWSISEMPDIKGRKVLIKPNLLDQVDNDLATTSPKIVGAIIDLLMGMGAGALIVGDGSAFRRDTRSVVDNCGLSDVLEKRGIAFIDLNYDELLPVRVRDGWIRSTDRLWLPRSAVEADFIISVPKLKTHHWAEVTLGMKNLLGIIPGSRYGWPKNIIHINTIHATILGLYQTLPTVLSIVDGIVGMEGNGPLFGKPVQHGLIAMGKDPLAVDIICAQLMGLRFEEIPHLSGAAWAGIGQASKIQTRGVSAEQLQQHYETAPRL